MKNSFIIKLILIFIFFQNILNAEVFNIESSEIKIKDKGNITEATNGVRVSSDDEIEIIGQNLIYDKNKSILKIFGDVIINDKKNKIESRGEEYTYFKKEEKIVSSWKTITNINNTYTVESINLIYERNSSEIHSENKTKIEDKNNIFYADKFKLNSETNLLKAKNLTLFDNKKNQYFLNFALVNLKENKFLGSDISIDFEDSLFGNNQNDPRLKGNSLIAENNISKVYKGTFTTCSQKKDNCPPWALYAEEVVHKQKEKKIEYKNAWLKIYDKPVLYFPYFFHPDPTVKRQSGFLMPSFQSSSNSGTSLQIPYYKVISENKDLTLYPRIFFDDKILLQSEYRQVNKNSDLTLDFSIKKDTGSTKKHFFADFSSINKNKNLDIHLESVSSDTYLKVDNIKSPIINDQSTLHSYINFSSYEESSLLDISFEVFEDLNKKKTDRYEYIFPNFNYEKYIDNNKFKNGDLIFRTNGYQKNYNANSDEIVLVNNLLYSSFSKNSSNFDGLISNHTFLLRNLNSSSENSDNYRNGKDNKILTTIIFDSELPLKKETKNFNNFLSPKLSARYSPNATKNNSNINKSISYDSIFSLDRVDSTAVEGGESLTLGLEYSASNKLDEEKLNLSFANILRLEENPDLPKIYGFSEKRSDILGNFKFAPSKFFNLNYQFSFDKKLERSNYNLAKADFNINNFVTSFEFLEEDNYLNEASYLSNKTKYIFDKNKSIAFETEKNLDQDITNYYNLIYEYQNDCLVAAVEYNKSFYADSDLKPEKNIFFSIKIIPFGKIKSPSMAN